MVFSSGILLWLADWSDLDFFLKGFEEVRTCSRIEYWGLGSGSGRSILAHAWEANLRARGNRGDDKETSYAFMLNTKFLRGCENVCNSCRAQRVWDHPRVCQSNSYHHLQLRCGYLHDAAKTNQSSVEVYKLPKSKKKQICVPIPMPFNQPKKKESMFWNVSSMWQTQRRVPMPL